MLYKQANSKLVIAYVFLWASASRWNNDAIAPHCRAGTDQPWTPRPGWGLTGV